MTHLHRAAVLFDVNATAAREAYATRLAERAVEEMDGKTYCQDSDSGVCWMTSAAEREYNAAYDAATAEWNAQWAEFTALYAAAEGDHQDRLDASLGNGCEEVDLYDALAPVFDAEMFPARVAA